MGRASHPDLYTFKACVLLWPSTVLPIVTSGRHRHRLDTEQKKDAAALRIVTLHTLLKKNIALAISYCSIAFFIYFFEMSLADCIKVNFHVQNKLTFTQTKRFFFVCSFNKTILQFCSSSDHWRASGLMIRVGLNAFPLGSADQADITGRVVRPYRGVCQSVYALNPKVNEFWIIKIHTRHEATSRSHGLWTPTCMQSEVNRAGKDLFTLHSMTTVYSNSTI